MCCSSDTHKDLNQGSQKKFQAQKGRLMIIDPSWCDFIRGLATLLGGEETEARQKCVSG